MKESPTRGPQPILSSAEKRIGSFAVSGVFSTPNTELVQMDYNSFNFDQKVTRIMGGHAVKLGVLVARARVEDESSGERFTYNNLDDLLANRSSAFLLAMGNPPHSAWLDQFGGFTRTTGGSVGGWCSTWASDTTSIQRSAIKPPRPGSGDQQSDGSNGSAQNGFQLPVIHMMWLNRTT